LPALALRDAAIIIRTVALTDAGPAERMMMTTMMTMTGARRQQPR